MRVSQEHKNNVKREILKAAGRGFREEGYGGLGVDGLAKRAGMTSGAFYGHFSSKDEAFKEAVMQGLVDYAEGIKDFEAQHGKNWPKKFMDYYLGEKHREDLSCSCAVPSLSADVMRADKTVKKAYENELEKISCNMAAGLGHKNTEEAWAFMAILAGSVIMARSVSSPKMAENISKAARKWAEKIIKN